MAGPIPGTTTSLQAHELFSTVEVRDMHQRGWTACFETLDGTCTRRFQALFGGQTDGDALHARWGSPPDNSLLQHGQPAADANGSRQGGAEGVCLFLRWC